MHVSRHAGVAVDQPSVPMHRNRPVRALPRRLHDRANAEPDEHDSDRELEQIRHRRRHFRAEQHEQRSHDDQSQRMAQAPGEPEQRGAHAAPFTADERRHRREMIRLERVPHPDERSESRAGEEFEDGHQQ